MIKKIISLLTFFLLIIGLFLEIPIRLDYVFESPSLNNPLGTDDLGRSLFMLIWQGLSFSIVLSAAALFLAFSLALIFIYFIFSSLKRDLWFTRLIEAYEALPSLVWGALFMGLFGVSASDFSRVLLVIIVLSLVQLPGLYKMLRAFILSEQFSFFIDGANGIGAHPVRILIKHILPQIIYSLSPLLVQRGMGLFLAESFLSFIGYGLRPPLVSMGLLLQRGWYYYSSAPYLLIIPGAVVSFVFYILRTKLIPSLQGGVKAQETDQ